MYVNKDLIAGLIFATIGVAFSIGSTQYSLGSATRPGPGYLPLALGAGLVVFGLMIAGLAWWRAPAPDKVEATTGLRLRPIIVLALTINCASFLLPVLGLVGTVPFLVLGSAFCNGAINWRTTWFTAAVLTAGCWAVFVLGLRVAMPVFPIGAWFLQGVGK
jgi:hypothetical protein